MAKEQLLYLPPQVTALRWKRKKGDAHADGRCHSRGLPGGNPWGPKMKCEIRPAFIEDGEAASAMILQTLRKTNARDYSPEIIERVASNFSPAALKELIASRTAFYVAAVGT